MKSQSIIVSNSFDNHIFEYWICDKCRSFHKKNLALRLVATTEEQQPNSSICAMHIIKYIVEANPNVFQCPCIVLFQKSIKSTNPNKDIYLTPSISSPIDFGSQEA